MKRNTRDYDRIFVGHSHQLYPLFLETYSAGGSAGDGKSSKRLRDLKHSEEIETSLSGGIAGKLWLDEFVCGERQTFASPLRNICADIKNNRVSSMHFHDPVYENEYVFKANILEGARIPEATLKPEDFEHMNRGGNQWRPNTGFRQNNNDYRNSRNPAVANRMLQ